MKKYRQYATLNLSQVAKDVLAAWERIHAFDASLSLRQDAVQYVFFEGPPSANGLPGIHHVMARTIKDIVCRYRTQKGFRVERKAGWDTHGLPVELGVEALLGITKEDIGKKISIEEYNDACRKEVMKYTDKWRQLTELMGYWVDLDRPYVTYHTKYIESLWWLLKKLYDGGFLYKGKTIQPYSPAAGTGLSTHELNQPGCYRDVSDTTVVGMFRVLEDGVPATVDGKPLYILAWTTTPWTLASNTALAVGKDIDYQYIETLNAYTGAACVVILAQPRVCAYFKEDGREKPLVAQTSGKATQPWRVLKQVKGTELVGMHYLPLFDWIRPRGEAYRVIPADYVTTEDGTGIVHIAPTFGADDARVAKEQGIVGMELRAHNDEIAPMVDRKGRFYPVEDLVAEYVREYVNLEEYTRWAGRYVKASYVGADDPMGGELDVDLCVELKKRGLAFRIEKHVHSYPHCWRTDKPVLYYPLDSWFIRTTAFRDRLLALNDTIDWHPESTGTGRFAKWLENLVDWNLSRSRFWGTPLPIWATKDRKELKCIGSLEELQQECAKAVAAGVMTTNPLAHFRAGDNTEANYEAVDIHRPYVDNIVLVASDGQPMYREPDLVDVWFDSGAMPYAQWHYPFENKEIFDTHFPADFIAEGVDQTRGWFFTLHAIATMISDSVAFKHIISNGLVLDREGNKMSKRLGNAIDPFGELESKGADAVRWYVITNSAPWDNLKYDPAGVEECVRKFFSTLHNTYSFFALYANVDNFDWESTPIPIAERPEIDRWILSRLNTLVRDVDESYQAYDLTRSGRLIQDFVTEHLSNWYVRLSRKRFWGGGLTPDKLAAYQTLHECLCVVSQLMAPIAPFYADQLYSDLLQDAQGQEKSLCVHLVDFPSIDFAKIDTELEARMELAQRFTSMILALRKKIAIKVRQPLAKIMIPVLDKAFAVRLQSVEKLLLNEVNVKRLEYLDPVNTVLVKRVKPDFKALGPKFGKVMKALAAQLQALSQAEIAKWEQEGSIVVVLEGAKYEVALEDVEIAPEDIPGCLVATDGGLTVALDYELTTELIEEGLAREFVNRIQNQRKENGYEVSDRIAIALAGKTTTLQALEKFKDYIQAQTLCEVFLCKERVENPTVVVDFGSPHGEVAVAIAKV
ncbi:MAG: isoleucine--tRNA ligase [Bacteroides sp.]